MVLVIVLFCEVLLILAGIYLIFSWLTQTPFYPSSVKQLDKLIEDGEIPLPKTDGEISFVDIGAGDGRFVVWAAKKGYSSEGIEFNPFLFLFSNLKIIFRGLGKNAKVHKKNFKKHNFDKYNMAYMYLFSEHMEAIREKLFAEMPKGSVVVTNTFNFKGLQEDKKIGKFYIYTVK